MKNEELSSRTSEEALDAERGKYLCFFRNEVILLLDEADDELRHKLIDAMFAWFCGRELPKLSTAENLYFKQLIGRQLEGVKIRTARASAGKNGGYTKAKSGKPKQTLAKSGKVWQTEAKPSETETETETETSSTPFLKKGVEEDVKKKENPSSGAACARFNGSQPPLNDDEKMEAALKAAQAWEAKKAAGGVA